MDSVKVKCRSGSFELTYPQSLQSVIPPLEFETTIRTLNSKSKTKTQKYALLPLVPILVGVVLLSMDYIIAGFIFIVIGVVFIGALSIKHHSNYTEKIQNELDIINDHYSSRRIVFSLGYENVYVPLSQFEIDARKMNTFNKNSKNDTGSSRNTLLGYEDGGDTDSIMMKDIEYDQNERPCKLEYQLYLSITFPASEKSENQHLDRDQLALQIIQNYQLTQQPNFNYDIQQAQHSQFQQSSFNIQ